MTTLMELQVFMQVHGYEFFNMSSTSRIGSTIILRASRKRDLRPAVGRGPTLDAAFRDMLDKFPGDDRNA